MARKFIALIWLFMLRHFFGSIILSAKRSSASTCPTSSPSRSCNIMSTQNLVDVAHKAIATGTSEHKTDPRTVDPNTNNNTANKVSISIAKDFLQTSCPDFLTSNFAKDDDRLVKVGRSIVDLVKAGELDSDQGEKLESSLSLLVDQCTFFTSDDMKVPKVRFGKTELQMPVVSLGCMRFQQTWGQNLKKIDEINPECQDNLMGILRHAIVNLGINHIETARGYGCSEVQLGGAFRNLFGSGEVKREDLIIQTKVNPMPPKAFRDTLETSLNNLDVGYIDLFAFHGGNTAYQYDLIFNNGDDENLIDIIREYQAAGKIRHVGFSTHGSPENISRLIETDAFDYVNLHYHLAHYTAGGGGKYGNNLQNIRLMKEKDMGVFIISPYDKGGRLYAPSRKLRSLTLPELEPITYGSLWLWNHEKHDEEKAPVHTISCGAARPSDLDEPAFAAYLHRKKGEEMFKKVQSVAKKLYDAQVEAFGEDWVKTWHEGLPNCITDDDAYQIGQIVSLYNLIKAWGMLDYAKDRYSTFDNNLAKWNFDIPTRENVAKMRGMWGYMPGIATEAGKDYSGLLVNVPDKNKEKVLEAIEFTHTYCSKKSQQPDIQVPPEWETAYDMRPWNAFPERG